eukprot:6214056-Pleurochrysis_carterae.AAC.1
MRLIWEGRRCFPYGKEARLPAWPKKFRNEGKVARDIGRQRYHEKRVVDSLEHEKVIVREQGLLP